MKRSLPLALFFLLLTACGVSGNIDDLKQAAHRIENGKAVLVDVREPSEWNDTGVAGPAFLLSKSSFDAGSNEWKAFLLQNKEREIILMCRSGNRSGQVARVLAKQGYRVTNLGGFSAWKNAKLPVRELR